MEIRSGPKNSVPLTFEGVKDIYNGVVVRSRTEPHERDVMERLLQGDIPVQINLPLSYRSLYLIQKIHLLDSLVSWSNSKIRGVWFEVEPDQAEWIPVLIKV